MADKPGQEAKDTGQKTIFNSGIGDDWGEAFEAEDFIAASPQEEAKTEFFLPDEALETIVDIPVAEGEKEELVEASFLGRLNDIRQLLFARFCTIPFPFRLAAVAIPILALILFFALSKAPPQPIAPIPEAQTETVPAVQTEPSVAHLPEAETGVPAEPHPAPEEAKVSGSDSSEVKMLRKKWRFPAIIVHTKTDKDHGPAIISTDLTLILKLAPGVMPPSGKDSFVREILYQFYANQPIDDLQRYALERGEMNRKLQAWIIKQWPELPLDSITVDRYQLL